LLILRIQRLPELDGTATLLAATFSHREQFTSFVYSNSDFAFRGNNGYAYRATDRHFAHETSKGTYAYRYNTRLEPDAADNLDASIVNAFYNLGKVHDVTYRYGFTEDAYNFQTSNFNRGGQQNDGIIVSVNDRSEYNNAFFTTPPEFVPSLNSFTIDILIESRLAAVNLVFANSTCST
jgi:hypothetical protein